MLAINVDNVFIYINVDNVFIFRIMFNFSSFCEKNITLSSMYSLMMSRPYIKYVRYSEAITKEYLRCATEVSRESIENAVSVLPLFKHFYTLLPMIPRAPIKFLVWLIRERIIPYIESGDAKTKIIDEGTVSEVVERLGLGKYKEDIFKLPIFTREGKSLVVTTSFIDAVRGIAPLMKHIHLSSRGTGTVDIIRGLYSLWILTNYPRSRDRFLVPSVLQHIIRITLPAVKVSRGGDVDVDFSVPLDRVVDVLEYMIQSGEDEYTITRLHIDALGIMFDSGFARERNGFIELSTPHRELMKTAFANWYARFVLRRREARRGRR